MYDEIFQAVKTLALSHASPFTAIEAGPMPASNGLAMYIGAGAPDWTYLDRGSHNTLSIALNGKHSNQQTVLAALSGIHMGLSQRKAYPSGIGWAVLDIGTGSAPNYIDREPGTGQWLYGSILRVKFYIKGV